MKNRLSITSFCTLLLVLFLVGCSKDNTDDNSKNNGNDLSLGVSANDLLGEEKYSSMRVEVVYTTNAAPAPATLASIKNFLEEHTNKSNGIEIYTKAIDPIYDSVFSISEVKDIEDEHRSTFNVGDEIAVFILFVDGKSETQEENKLVLGTAYKNTSMVIFEQTVAQLSKTSGVPKSNIESATIKHEFGHLFGLVDNGSPAQSQHEDTKSKSHCNVDGCIMVAAMEFGNGALSVLGKTASPGFGESCRKDLQANGGK